MEKITEEDSTNEIIEEAHDRRSVIGSILERAIIIEGLIENLICYYLINDLDKRVDFFIIMKNFTFEKKRQMLRTLRLRDGEFEVPSTLHKDIEWVQEIRNAVAHNIKHRDEKEKTFKIFYKGDKEISLNEKFLIEFSERATKLEGALSKLIREIEKKK